MQFNTIAKLYESLKLRVTAQDKGLAVKVPCAALTGCMEQSG